MIIRSKSNIKEIIRGDCPLMIIYRNGQIVWSKNGGEVAKSCFGNGYWVNTLPWINSDAWKNN